MRCQACPSRACGHAHPPLPNGRKLGRELSGVHFVDTACFDKPQIAHAGVSPSKVRASRVRVARSTDLTGFYEVISSVLALNKEIYSLCIHWYSSFCIVLCIHWF